MENKKELSLEELSNNFKFLNEKQQSELLATFIKMKTLNTLEILESQKPDFKKPCANLLYFLFLKKLLNSYLKSEIADLQNRIDNHDKDLINKKLTELYEVSDYPYCGFHIQYVSLLNMLVNLEYKKESEE